MAWRQGWKLLAPYADMWGHGSAVGAILESKVVDRRQPVLLGSDALDRRPQLAAALAAGMCPVIANPAASAETSPSSPGSAQGVPFIVAELCADTDPLLLHPYTYAVLWQRRSGICL